MKKTITIKISGMHCVSCAMNIDGELEDTKGIIQSITNFYKQETLVIFDHEQISQHTISNIIKKLGYIALIE